jgi:hypothetical protein
MGEGETVARERTIWYNRKKSGHGVRTVVSSDSERMTIFGFGKKRRKNGGNAE